MTNQKSSNNEQAKQVSVSFTDNGWEDYQYWQKTDTKQRLKINDLIDACLSDPLKESASPSRSKAT